MSRIRLLNVSSSIISLFPLHETPPYVAVSHAWADRLFPDNVPVMESTGGLSVKTAIEAQHLDVHYCWIDNFCILQDDENDKLEQIPMMGAIYHNARAVVVILSCTFEFTQFDVDRMTKELTPALSIWEDETWAEEKNIRFWNRRKGRQILVRAMKGLARLTMAAWGTRIWTLQEFILAKSVVWVGKDLYPISFNPRFLQAIPGLCSDFMIQECLNNGQPRAEFALLYTHFSGMSSCHLGDVEKTRVMELLGNRSSTVPVDEVYGAMAASGVEIQPLRGETREKAWQRWCEEALRQGHVRWIMLPEIQVKRTSEYENLSTGRNCAFPSFATRHLASSASYLDSVKILGEFPVVVNGIVSLQGRRVGTCLIIRRLGSIHKTADGTIFRDITAILFSRGQWSLATQIAAALSAGRYSKRQLLALSQVLVRNYQRAVNCVSQGKEIKFFPHFINKLQKRVWGDFMQLMALGAMDLINESTSHLATIHLKSSQFDFSFPTLVVSGKNVLKDGLDIFDFNAVTRTGRHIFMLAETSYDYVRSTNVRQPISVNKLHKVATTIPIAKEIRYLLQILDIEYYLIGGDDCPGCESLDI